MKKLLIMTFAASAIITLSSSSLEEPLELQGCASITNLLLRDATTGSVAVRVQRNHEYIVEVMPGSNNVSACIVQESDYTITSSPCSDITLGSWSPIGRIFINADAFAPVEVTVQGNCLTGTSPAYSENYNIQ